MSSRGPRRPSAPPPSQADVMRVLDRMEESLREGLEALRSRGDLNDQRLDRIEGRIAGEIDARSRESAQQNAQLERLGQTLQQTLTEFSALRAGIAGSDADRYREAAQAAETAAGADNSAPATLTGLLTRGLQRPRLSIAALVVGAASLIAWFADIGPKLLKAIAAFWKISGSADV